MYISSLLFFFSFHTRRQHKKMFKILVEDVQQPGQLSRQSMRLLISGSWVRAPRWACFVCYHLTFENEKMFYLSPKHSASEKLACGQVFVVAHGSMVQWYDSRFGCERPRVRIPVEPGKFSEIWVQSGRGIMMAMSPLKAVKLDQTSDCSTEIQCSCQRSKIEAC